VTERFAVVGGGIAGLAAAWELRKVRPDAEITLLDADDRVGGKIRTTPFAGRMVDEGADAFLARVPYAAALAREIGLGDDLVSPATGQASLWIGDSLKPIPAGHVLGVPTDIDLVAKSGILSDEAVERARREPDIGGAPLGPEDDVAIGELVARRYGQEVQDLLVDPLLGGINAGRSMELSAEVGASQIVAAARRDASLTRALVAMREENPPDPAAPVFWAPSGGMQRLSDAVAAALAEKGVDIRTGVTVESLGDLDSGGIVLATPAFVSAELVRNRSARAADALAEIEYASVVLATIAYRRSDLRSPLTGSGFLVPRTERRFLTAGSVFSNKWPALDYPDLVIIRASAGRAGDDTAIDLDDEGVVARMHAELAEALAIGGDPVEVRLSRWRRAFPQFRPGHLGRMRAVHDALAADSAGVVVAGAAVQGVGIPTCILSAQQAVHRLLT
jgi:protoporphyrinogen/coproporphyrinogen III oxidase